MALRVTEAFALDLPLAKGQAPGSTSRRSFQVGDRVPESIVHRIPEGDTRTEVVPGDAWDPPEPFPAAKTMTPASYTAAAVAWMKAAPTRAARAARAEEARLFAARFHEPDDPQAKTPAEWIREEDAKDPGDRSAMRGI